MLLQADEGICRKGKYVAVLCDLGAFTLESIDLLLKIHSPRNIKNDVLKEQQWLKKDIKVPVLTCSYSKEDLASYADKISNTPNNCSPMEDDLLNICIGT